MITEHIEPKYNCDNDTNNFVLSLHFTKPFLRQLTIFIGPGRIVFYYDTLTSSFLFLRMLSIMSNEVRGINMDLQTFIYRFMVIWLCFLLIRGIRSTYLTLTLRVGGMTLQELNISWITQEFVLICRIRAIDYIMAWEICWHITTSDFSYSYKCPSFLTTLNRCSKKFPAIYNCFKSNFMIIGSNYM